jgi:hypothetical protein
MYCLLSQLGVKFENQKTFSWATSKKYDFYIQSLNCIIETHGLQHYKNQKRGRSLEKEQKNDLEKINLALDNKIMKYIVLDCRFSDFEFIKNSILKSELRNIFNFSNIDWLKCHEFAIKTIVKKACDLWNEGDKNTNKIGEILNLGRCAIISYLKRGAEIGWCDYDSKVVSKNGRAKGHERIKEKISKKVVQLAMDGELIKEWNSLSEAAKTLSISAANISTVCNGRLKSAGGFKWIHFDKYVDQKRQT